MEEKKVNIWVNDEECGLKKGDLLYKYTSLGEYTDADKQKMKTIKFNERFENTESLLQKNEIWFSKYKNLNDPYEVTVSLSKKQNEKQIKRDNIFNRGAVEILSLTDTDKNLLMWAHYAKEHKGYCIEFVVEDPSKISKVQYLEEIPEGISRALVDVKDEVEKNKICKCFLNKSKVWEYEKEYRVINIDELYGMSTKEERRAINLNEIGLKLNRIILGANCNDELAKRIVAECSKANIPCVQAKIRNDKYGIRISKSDLKKKHKIG